MAEIFKPLEKNEKNEINEVYRSLLWIVVTFKITYALQMDDFINNNQTASEHIEYLPFRSVITFAPGVNPPHFIRLRVAPDRVTPR